MHITQRQLQIIGGGAGFILVLFVFLVSSNGDSTHNSTHTNDKATDQVESVPSEETTIPETETSNERTFIEEMIPHHQAAVDAATIVLSSGATTPAIRALTELIIEAQTKEIASMKRWYQNWYGVPYKDSNTYTPMMRDMGALSGKELDTVFLTDMVDHHLHAIMMAQDVAPFITRPEVDSLARDIAANQSNEIVTIKTILKQL